jgi:hypothetical protein
VSCCSYQDVPRCTRYGKVYLVKVMYLHFIHAEQIRGTGVRVLKRKCGLENLGHVLNIGSGILPGL